MYDKELNMQLQPSKQLSNLVKHYLVIENQTSCMKAFRLFTDGNDGIVFSFKSRLATEIGRFKQPDYLPEAFVYGQINTFKTIYCVDHTALLIVVFHPHGLNQLLGIPADELIDEIIDLRLLFGAAGAELTERLQACTSVRDRIELIESFLISVSKHRAAESQQIVLAAVNYIMRNEGLISVNQLAAYTGYTGKTMERKFMEIIGLPPKRFSNIIRQNVYLKGLRDSSTVNLSDLAYRAGYYDHSHAFREFKRNTGVTPGQYVGNVAALALNLLELPDGNGLLLSGK